MPNQRNPDKRKLSTWMFDKDIKVLRDAAEEEGVPLSELLLKVVRELERKKDRQKGR